VREYPSDPLCLRCGQRHRDSVACAADAAAIRADEREKVRGVLKEHYLMQVVCDPGGKRDNPVCGCSRVHLGWHLSIGAAIGAWIDHVIDLAATR